MEFVEGTTAFIIPCIKCQATAFSTFYRINTLLTPEYEWYKPDPKQRLTIAEREHINNGSLLLRKYNG